MHHHWSRKDGFTLVEMLTVICIISILAAMLFPALSGAKENARKTSCQNNVRQIGFATLMYSDDNNGVWPGPGPFTIALNRYVKNRGVYKCPSDEMKNKFGELGSPNERVSFARNSQTFEDCSGGTCTLRPLNMALVVRPSRFVMYVDDANATDPGVWAVPRNDKGFRTDSQVGRHNGQDDYVFADSHVKAIPSKNVTDGSEFYNGVTWNPNLSP